MTTFPALVDVALERQLVRTLIASPDEHEACGDLGVTDFGDPHARSVYAAVANLRARYEYVDAEAVRAELVADLERYQGRLVGEREIDWYDRDILSLAAASPPEVARQANAITMLAEARRAAVVAAEPARKRPPAGPRADSPEPTRLAEAFRRYSYERNGIPLLVRWARAWWRYDGARYVEIDDELLERDLIAFLDVVVAPLEVTDKKTGQVRTQLGRVKSRRSTIAEVKTALGFAMPQLSGGAPQWTASEDGDPPAADCVVCRNGILNLHTLELAPSTPRLFATTAIGASWQPDIAPPAAWLAFLRDLWGDDTESIQTLQQLFGYLLTPDTSQQKIFAIIGPPRSGKGTIARVLRALLGEDAVVNPTLQSLERPFGLAPLVGKTVAIIGDARLGGHSDQQQVVERLLSISGEDALSIDRKLRDPINVRLRTRVLLLSNELPKLYDTSGALPSRFVILTLSRSFLGVEDRGLESRLLAELPGIFRWAVDGYQDLAEHGRFVVPLASERASEHLRAISNPLGVFLDECCEIGVPGQVSVDELYQRYVGWCEGNGRQPANKQVLSRDLHTVHPEVFVRQITRADGRRIRVYEGVKLA